MPVTINSPSGDGEPISVDDYPDIESFLEAYREQLEDESPDGVEVIDDRGVLSDGESGYVGYKYTDPRNGERQHIELLVLRGSDDDDVQVFPFDFDP